MSSRNAAESVLSAPLNKTADTGQKRWFLRYVLSVALLVFTGRAAPLSFLPLVLQDDFKQSPRVVGIVMAIYPFAALAATPWATRLAQKTRRIVMLHSVALLSISAAMVLTSVAQYVGAVFGLQVGVCWLGFCRAVQGVGNCLYLSSNTSLITRRFPENLPYVIALTEVAVGSGGQVGRITGGVLFDLGGFSCPFMAIAVVQGLLAVVGFGFEERSEASNAALVKLVRQTSPNPSDPFVRQRSTSSTFVKEQLKQQLRWSALVTPRLCVGGVAAFMHYFIGCMFDATGLQYLYLHLAPVSVATLSLLLSIRGFTYLLSSYLIAQLMRHELVSFERLILCGATLGFIAQIVMAPQAFISLFIAFLESESEPSRGSLWLLVVISLILAQLGGALMFVPSLPLMQSEVRKHGDFAIEKAAEGLVTMMTLGEMLGPIWGGWLVGQVGYIQGTLVMALLVVPFWMASVATYDSAVVKERRRQKEHISPVHEEPGLKSEENAIGLCDCAPQCAPVQCGPPGSIGDGDVSFAVRRAPFAHQVLTEMETTSDLDSEA